MKKIFNIFIVIIIFISCFFIHSEDSNALEVNDYQNVDSYLDTNTEITYMNEDGSISKDENRQEAVYGSDKQSTNNQLSPRVYGVTSSTVAVVNFRTKSDSSKNTEYTEVTTGRAGYTNGYYAADGAFLGFDNDSNPTKVKFIQAGVVGWVNYSEVEVVAYSSNQLQTTSKYYVSNGRLYHGIVSNISNTSYSSSIDCGKAPSYLAEGNSYFSYDGHYFYNYNGGTTGYKTMLTDYRNNVRTNAINATNPYYNYYQYLSHRSKTVYTANQLNSAIAYLCQSNEKSYGRTSKMRNLGSCLIENQNKYGVNAMLIIGVAANESAWGCSGIAYNKNNLFGHAAYDSDPNGSSNAYSSVEYSVYYHASTFVSKGYLDCITDGRYYGAHVGDKASGMGVKYASDPYWGEKAAAMAWKVDAYLGNKDSYKYTIGIKDTLPTNHSIINVKSSASSTSSTLYSTYPVSSKTSYKGYAPSQYPFIVLKNGQANGYYKIQTDSEVNSARTGMVVQEAYTYTKSYGYIPTDSIEIVSQGSNSTSLGTNTQNNEGASTGKSNDEPTIYYEGNCQDTGWLGQINEPNTAGTTGQSLDLYQIKILLKNVNDDVILSGKVYSDGEWLNYDNITSSTLVGKDSQAMQFVNFILNNLSGYQLQYRVHSADVGWQNWVDAGTQAGTSGKNIQAIEFRLIKIEPKPITSVTLNKTEMTLEKTNTETLEATINPSDTTDNKTLIWKSSDQNVATVDQNGKVTGVNTGTASITVTTSNNKTATCQVTVIKQKPTLSYQTHVQDYGWQATVSEGEMSGTTRKSKRLEGIRININNNESYTGSIQYRTHVQDYGWQNWVSNGELSGTSGQSKRLEAIQIRLTGEMADNYDVYYRVHAQEFGWLDWAKNGESSGTAGYSYRLEAIEIKLVEKEGSAPGSTAIPYHQKYYVGYQTHVQDYGWQGMAYDGSTSGTTGRSKRLEGIQIKLENPLYEGNIEYKTHIQDIGWETSWTSNGSTSGTTGKSKRLEAIQIKLTGEMANQYNIYYRVHAQDYGWLGWASDGASAGTEGLSKRLEGIQIKLVKKGEAAPGSIDSSFIRK